MIFSPSSHKPLYLFHLLHTLSVASALCFTKSVEAAVRLAKLVDLFEEERVAADSKAKKAVVHTYSSDLSPSERSRVMASFKKGEIQMYVLLPSASPLPIHLLTRAAQAHLLRFDRPRYRLARRLARHQLRRSDRHAQVRPPCRPHRPRGQVGRRLESRRGSRGSSDFFSFPSH